MPKSPNCSYWGPILCGVLFLAALYISALSVDSLIFEQKIHQNSPMRLNLANIDPPKLVSLGPNLTPLSPSIALAHTSFRGVELINAGFFASGIANHNLSVHALQPNLSITGQPINDRGEPRISPYTWHAEYSNGQLVITGFVPTESVRDAIMVVAKEAFLRSAIIDKMAIAAGEPPHWLATATIAIRQLAVLNEGKVSLQDMALEISGVAQREEMADRIRTTLSSGLAASYKLGHDLKFIDNTIRHASPFTTTITLENGSFELSGNTPGIAAVERLTAIIKSARPHAAIVNDMAIASGAPEGWIDCVAAGLASLLKVDEGSIKVVDSELLFTGHTREEKVGEELPRQLRAAANRACQETIKLHVEVPPEPALNWHAIYKDNMLSISGQIPYSDVQNDLTELAGKLFPDAERVIDLRVHPSRTEKWPRVATMALQLLARLRNGEAQLQAQTLTLTGEAEDIAAKTAIHEQLKAGIASGYHAVAEIEVKSAAMLWAERQAKLNLSVTADDKTVSEPDATQKKDQPDYIKGARSQQSPAAMSSKISEVVSVTETLQQKLDRPRADQSIPDQSANHKRQFKANIEDQHLQAKLKNCQSALDGVMRTGTIAFAAGSDRVSPDSVSTLTRLAHIGGLCEGNFELEISGHTDNSGSAASNRKLSQRRAEVVQSYLIKYGISAAQLSARGLGEARPLVPNTTPANRARNRRIELRVKIRN